MSIAAALTTERMITSGTNILLADVASRIHSVQI